MDEPKVIEHRNGLWMVRSKGLLSEFRTLSQAAKEIAGLHRLCLSLDEDNQKLTDQLYPPPAGSELDEEHIQCRDWIGI